jgi:hypothetical protein
LKVKNLWHLAWSIYSVSGIQGKKEMDSSALAALQFSVKHSEDSNTKVSPRKLQK